MAFIRLITSRTARTSSMVMIGGLFVLQLVVEALRVARIATGAPGAFWAWYATYALIGVLFFLAGSLTWLYGYARQRTVATLLFWFCNLSMFAFGTLSGDRLAVIQAEYARTAKMTMLP